MASISNLKKGDKVIYYGYGIPRRHGERCIVNAVSANEEEAIIISDSDRFCMSCKDSFLKMADEETGTVAAVNAAKKEGA